MHIIDAPIDLLDDAPLNANKMTPAKLDQLVQSIKRVGFVQHILVTSVGDRWQIVDGHHRRRAMAQLGRTHVPAVVLEPGEDPRLVALALNRIRGETDLSVAAQVVTDLMEVMDASALDISGFSERELASLVDALEGPREPTLADLAEAELPEPVEEPNPEDRPFVLELAFRSRADLNAAKRALRRAAGKGGDLADGLLRLAGGDEE